jgi:general stress protein 26
MSNNSELKNIVRDIFASQRLAVLATEKENSPYINLVVFIADKDLKWLVFATNRSTRKFENIMANPMVAILIDNRCKYDFDTKKTVVISALGKAEGLLDFEKAKLMEQYLDKHPHLKDFITSSDCVFVKLKIEKYIIVQRFQEVSELDISQ